MKNIFLLFPLLFVLSFTAFPQIAINISGDPADASAMLDVSSTTKGMLIPRMTAGERIVLASKVQGLLVYQTNATQGFYYYDGSNWFFLLNQTYNSSISDTDGNTKVQVEESADEDIIRFDMEGTEYFTMQNGHLNILNTGKSVFIGEGAGEVDDLTSNNNVFVGYQVGKSNTIGNNNTANGYQALFCNTIGSNNTAIGHQANMFNQTGSENTIIGHYAGRGTILHNKSGNVFLGYSAGQFEDGNNKLYIQNSNSLNPLIYGEFDNDLLRIYGELELNNGAPPSSLKFFEPGGSGSNYTIFQSQAQATDITYTLPASAGTNGQVLQTNGSSVLSWASPSGGDITAVGSMTSGDAFSDLAADNQWLGLGSSVGRIEFDNQTLDEVNILDAEVGIGTNAPTQKLTLHDGNMLFTNSGTAGELRLEEPAASGSHYTAFKAQAQASDITYTLPTNDGSSGQLLETDGSGVLSWASPSDGDITAVGSMTSGDVFAGPSANGKWLGLGAAAGRITFSDLTIDYVNIHDAYVGIGTSIPEAQLHIQSFGDAGIIINADSDNAGGEDDNPRLEFRQDGESVIGAMGYIGSAGSLYTGSTANSLYVMNEYNSPLFFGANNTIDLTIQSDGDVVINSLGTGTVYSNSGRLTNVNPSDKRLKENIEDITTSLNEFMQLRPVTFNWKNTGNQSMGFIAQEVEKVIPELVGTNEDGSKGIYSTEMIPYMVKAMQEQQEMIDALLQQNRELKKRMEKLEKK